nr:MAG TPA: Adenosylhomocysteinase [Herelleviridae sp.]
MDWFCFTTDKLGRIRLRLYYYNRFWKSITEVF